MKNIYILKRNKTNLFLLLGLVLILLEGCTSDNGEGWSDERYDSNFELYFDNPNPKTGVAYTEDELGELKYDHNKTERFKGEEPVVLNLFLSKEIKEVKIVDGTNGSVLKTLTESQKQGDKFKVTLSTSLTVLNIIGGSQKGLKFNIAYSDGSIGSVLYVVASVLPLPPAADILKGQWKFDDASNLTKATIGEDLVLAQDKIHSAVSGIISGDGASLVDLNSRYEVDHKLPKNGGEKVNVYTLIFDVNVPSTSGGNYVNLLQTLTDNSADGSTYISPSGGLWGNGIGSSGSGAIKHDNTTWHRVVITVGDGDYRAYIDGVKILAGSPGPDGIHALALDKFLLFADNGSEDYPIKVSEVMLFDVTFADVWVLEDVPAVGIPLP